MFHIYTCVSSEMPRSSPILIPFLSPVRREHQLVPFPSSHFFPGLRVRSHADLWAAQSRGDRSLGLESAFATCYPTDSQVATARQHQRLLRRGHSWGPCCVSPPLLSQQGAPGSHTAAGTKEQGFFKGLLFCLFKAGAVTKASLFLLKPQIHQPQQPTEV